MKVWIFTVSVLYWVCDEGQGLGRSLANTRHRYLLTTSSRKTRLDLSKIVEEKRRKLRLNENFQQKDGNPGLTSTKKNGKNQNRNKMSKRPLFLKGGRKSTIDFHDDQARMPVLYSSQDGKDNLIYIKVKSEIPFATQTATYIPAAPSLPSKTFLVTIYGQQLEGIEDKLRHVLSTHLETTTGPCECPCCPCACSSPKLLTEFDCSCKKPAPCLCEPHRAEQESNKGVSTLMIFPKTGQSLAQSGCDCPCCLCSCTEPYYENYDCGCQKSPPVPCPCTSTRNSEIQQNSTSFEYSDHNCQCQSASADPCSCAVLSSPTPETNDAAHNENQLTTWSAESSSSHSCSCPCCPCACSQPAPYPSDYCACTNNPATPCLCAVNAVTPSQLLNDNNVARTTQSNVDPMSTLPVSSGITGTQTYVGEHHVQDKCSCFCCPCSCPDTFSDENRECTCGSVRMTYCTCQH